MGQDPTYVTYVRDRAHMAAYQDYQKRYASRIRESDKILIRMIRDAAGGKPASLLDIGCSTGNLLLHLKHALPALSLAGGDIVADIIRDCRKDPALAGVRFDVMDMFRLPRSPKYEIVVANASLMFFTPAEFDRAVRALGAVLRPAGSLIVFDYFHPYEQQLNVVERTRAHPKGLQLYMRGFDVVRRALKKARFEAPEFRPFDIPIDLPKPAKASDITTHTVRTVKGDRMSFRGTLFQPWCHLSARKKR